ncbi:MAG: hypothetical protein ACTH5S_09975, partial [Hafnia alvei]|uniref:hypothetical protein n=1 Tax=Hafnia alvei TaxID=569 RepID=UPI003F92FBFB
MAKRRLGAFFIACYPMTSLFTENSVAVLIGLLDRVFIESIAKELKSANEKRKEFQYEILKRKKPTFLSAFQILVELSGIEPLTSCMPCKR